MKIRSITCFVSPKGGSIDGALAGVARLAEEAKAAYEAADYEVQTTRLATTPFPQWIEPLTQSHAVEAAVAAETNAMRQGFGYVSLGPALPDVAECFSFIPDMLKATKNSFFSGVIATRTEGISMAALRACAGIIVKASHLETNGFANLRFAALANVAAGSPFFPAAYHAGKKPAFAIAPQAADLAVQAFSDAHNIAEGSRALTASIEVHAAQLSKVGERLAKKHNVAYGGIDFSLAPFPEENESLGTSFERLGVPRIGLQGSLAAAAILTQAIDAAQFKRTGFSGLLLPVLEDYTLAKRVSQGALTVNDLLIYSAVCGTGLDTVPLPGDTSAEQLEAVLLDLAALALRLDKPLTARLMPIPGKAAGKETAFDFPFFANSRVMSLRAEPLTGALKESQQILLSKRTRA